MTAMEATIDTARPDDAYSRFADGLPNRGGKRGVSSVATLDNFNGGMADLACYFAELDVARLRSAWVGLVVDVSSRPFRPGEIARALLVVAARLHGVVWHAPAEVECPASVIQEAPTMTQTPGKAAMIQDGTRTEDAAFRVMSGPPPLPKRMGRVNPLADAIRALREGQWIVVKKDKIKPSAVTATVNKVRSEGKDQEDLRSYGLANGDRVVIRDTKPAARKTA